MAASDGPFGTAPDIGIGFSDVALLTFSFGGLAFLAFTLYSVVISRLKTRAELGDEDGDDTEKKYEEQLTEADVSTLSRAQRRARARQIMKQQRRAVPQNAATGNENEALAIVPAEGEENERDGHPQPVLSRKERQRLAKVAEREERKLLEDERKEQQKIAQQEAHQRKLERLQEQARQQEEMKQKQEAEKIRAAQAKQDEWETFLQNPDTDQRLSVADWLGRLKESPMVDLGSLAAEFDLTVDVVRKAIERLVHEQRVTGVFATESLFVVFGESQVRALVEKVIQEGEIGVDEIAEWMNGQFVSPAN